MGLEACVKGAEDEASGLGGVVVFAEMGESSSGESQGTPFDIYILIAQTKHDLREIGFGPFGLGSDHFEDAVEVGRYLFWYFFLHVRELVVEVRVDVELEGVHDFFTSLMQVEFFYLVFVPVIIQGFVVQFIDFYDLFLDISLNLFPGDAICSSDGEGVSD